MPAKKTTTKRTPASPAVAKTVVRNSPIPRPVAAKKEVTREQIALHAYYIWTREGGSEYDNWVRAERELRGA